MPPSPSPSPSAEQAIAGLPIELVVALIGLAGVALTMVVGYWQWRRGQAHLREADRKRLKLEDELARARMLWDESRQEARAAAEQSAEEIRRTAEAAERAVDLRRAADHYRALIVEDLRNLKILDMSKPLDLEALYVQLQVREEVVARFANAEEMEPVAQGSPERLLQLSAKQARDAQASASTTPGWGLGQVWFPHRKSLPQAEMPNAGRATGRRARRQPAVTACPVGASSHSR